MKKLISTMAAVAVLAGATSAGAATGFQDVPVQNPYAKYVNDLQDKGIVVGNGSGNFNPLDNLTRAEFATMAVKAFGLPVTSNPVKFADSRGHWGAAFIQSGVEAGIISGTSSTTFDPDSKVKREEAAAIVWRWLVRKGVATKATTGGEDAEVWAREAVQNVLAYDLHGVDVQGTAYRSLDDMTRQESAALFSTSLKVQPASKVGVVNPTPNANNIIVNADGSFSFGNIEMTLGYHANQSAGQAQTHMNLFGKIKFTVVGDTVNLSLPSTGTDSLCWSLQDAGGHVWRGSEGKQISFTDKVGVAVSLIDNDTAQVYGDVTLFNKGGGNWLAQYPKE